MSEKERQLIQMLREQGGLGAALSEKRGEEILCGRVNHPENPDPIDREKFADSVKATLDNHPVEWLLQ